MTFKPRFGGVFYFWFVKWAAVRMLLHTDRQALMSKSHKQPLPVLL